MPILTYRCKNGHEQEDFVPLFSDRSETLSCRCGELAKRVPSLPAFRLGWKKTMMDTAAQVWEGSTLEGTDGREGYIDVTDNKVQFDLGHTGHRHRPPREKRRGPEFAGADDS